MSAVRRTELDAECEHEMARTGLVVVSLLLACGQAWGGSIDLFSTPDYNSTCLELPVEAVSGTIYIVASGPFADLCGDLIGAEFGVDGLPSGWVTSSTPSLLASVSIGDPFAAGANISFPVSPPESHVLLYTVTLFRVPPIRDALLRVRAHADPPGLNANCPFVVGQNSPCDPDLACVDGGELLVTTPGQCVVGVARETWSVVKALYQ